jgi:hypothetical protein
MRLNRRKEGFAAAPRAIDFDAAFRARLRDLLMWRRDVRRFRPDPLPSGMLESLIELACLAPSVGLSQPWRFVIVERPFISRCSPIAPPRKATVLAAARCRK